MDTSSRCAKSMHTGIGAFGNCEASGRCRRSQATRQESYSQKSSWELGIKWNTSNNGVKSHREADRSHLKGKMENKHWAPNLILVKNIHSVFLSQNTRLGHKNRRLTQVSMSSPFTEVKLKLVGFKWTQMAMVGEATIKETKPSNG